MIVVDARKLVRVEPETLWKNLKGRFLLQCCDGTIEVREKDVLYSTYLWEFFKQYPLTPISTQHILSTVLGGNLIGGKTHIKLASNILFSVFDAYRHSVTDQIALLDDLARIGYKAINELYNNLTYKTEAYVVSIDILDFKQVAEYPPLIDAMNELDNSVKAGGHSRDEMEEMIKKCYAIINDTIKSKTIYPNNPLVMAAQAGIVSIDQTRQCVGPRGFLTDVDSMIFSKPITRGFYHGIRSLSDMMMESRSASISLAMQQDPLKKAEYFSRRMQLVCFNLKRLHITDCGSTHYLPFRVGEKDLETIEGSWYMDDDEKLKIVKRSDKALVGRYLRLRSIVAGCMHPDPQGVCVTCFGEIGYAIPANSNLGHAAATTTNRDVTQIVLSTKHFIGSSSVGHIHLDEVARRFMNTKKNFQYYLESELFSTFRAIKLIVNSKDTPGITDPKIVDNVKKLNIRRVGEFSSVLIETVSLHGEVVRTELKTQVDNRIASFTHEMLAHIKNTELGVTQDGSYVIDITNWDSTKPFLELTMRHFNMSDHQKAIESVIEGSGGRVFTGVDLIEEETDAVDEEDSSEVDVEAKTKLDEIDTNEVEDILETLQKVKKKRTPREAKRKMTPEEVLIELHDVINRRLKINLSVLAAIVYAYSAVNPSEFDYSLPKPWTTNEYGNNVGLHDLRSLSSTMAYERHQLTLNSPLSYLIRNRMNVPFDRIIAGDQITQMEQDTGFIIDC